MVAAHPDDEVLGCGGTLTKPILDAFVNLGAHYMLGVGHELEDG